MNERKPLTSDGLHPPVLSADEQLVFAESPEGHVRVHATRSGKLVAELPVSGVELSADGRYYTTRNCPALSASFDAMMLARGTSAGSQP